MVVGRDVLGPRRPEFWQEAPEYHGVLASAGAWRLAVSPNGKRYVLQELVPAGVFVVRRWRKRLSELAPDVPEALRSALRRLPEWPGDVDRPWSEAVEAERRRLRRENPARDEYRSVVVADGAARLAMSPQGRAYWVQVREADTWVTVKQSRRLSGVVLVLGLCSRAMAEAAEGLPEVASDCWRATRSVQDGREGGSAGPPPGVGAGRAFLGALRRS